MDCAPGRLAASAGNQRGSHCPRYFRGTLAVEHTSIHAFVQHQREEKWLGQIAEQIETATELKLPDRRVSIILNREVFEGLNKKRQGEYTRALVQWLAETLPGLAKGTHQLIAPSLLRDKPPITVEIDVDDFLDGLRPICVSAMLPGDAATRAAPQVEQILKSKLPKLSKARADYKILLVELPTRDTSEKAIINMIKNSGTFAPTLEGINYVVVAKTITAGGAGTAWYFAYDTPSYELGEIGCVTWSDRPTLAALDCESNG